MQRQAHDREDFAQISAALLESIEHIARDGPDLILLPEGTVPGYVLGPRPLHTAEYTACIADIAHIATRTKVHIIFGAPVASAEHERPLNAAVVCTPGGRQYAVGKRFLWHFDRHWFRAGTNFDPIDTELGRLGILVCADGRVPTLAATLADRGAQILLMPTAWVADGANIENPGNIQADLLARMRAWENGIPLVAANKCGVERGGVLYCGKSQIIDAGGTVLACASAGAEETLHHEIELPARGKRRSGATVTRDIPPFTPPPAPRRAALAFTATPELLQLAAWSDVTTLLAVHPGFAAQNPEHDDAFTAPALVVLPETPGVFFGSVDIFGVAVDDEMICDPTVLPRYRQRGVVCAAWHARDIHGERAVQLARTRALELRMYVLVFERAEGSRAFVADPDGVIICGTSREFKLTQWTYDHLRTQATGVAPGTDILQGLAMIGTDAL